jgi:hypothetical protein
METSEMLEYLRLHFEEDCIKMFIEDFQISKIDIIWTDTNNHFDLLVEILELIFEKEYGLNWRKKFKEYILTIYETLL